MSNLLKRCLTLALKVYVCQENNYRAPSEDSDQPSFPHEETLYSKLCTECPTRNLNGHQLVCNFYSLIMVLPGCLLFHLIVDKLFFLQNLALNLS